MQEMKYSNSDVESILREKYKEDTILLIATANNNIPTVRSIDTFYYQGSFYIVTDTSCNYVQEVINNENVMLSDGGHNRFWCKGEMIGHPLQEKNKEIRDVYMKVFHHWYKEVNNEELDTVCYIKATPYKGYIHKDKVGYSFDVLKDTVTVKEITHHIDVKLEPFW